MYVAMQISNNTLTLTPYPDTDTDTDTDAETDAYAAACLGTFSLLCSLLYTHTYTPKTKCIKLKYKI